MPKPQKKLSRSYLGLGPRSIAVVAVLALAGCQMMSRPSQSADTTAAAAPVAATPPAAAAPEAAAPVAAAAGPKPPPVLPYDEAVLSAANNLLSKAALPAGQRFDLVIDPLIDGVTGAQTVATQAMGTRLAKLIQDSYAQRYTLQPFRADTVQKGPLVLIGTFTGVNAQRKTEGLREAYRICFALADLKTGKLVSKGLAFAQPQGVDPTPLPFFRDAPAWLDDPATTGYVRTCQGTKTGDAINAAYIDRILTAATVAEAIDAYAAGQYADALKLYETARDSPGGQQLRVHTGLYLTNLKLRRMGPAREAFGDVVEQGLAAKRLGMKFLFKPGTAAPWADPKAGPQPYKMWVQEIAAHAAKRQDCLELDGHTSPTGAEPINERLSVLRANRILKSIESAAPKLKPRLSAKGYGSSHTLVGNGRDDLSDALDRRVEFVVKDCS